MLRGYCLIVIVCLAVASSLARGAEAKRKPARRVGEIFVIGNKVMDFSAFLDRLGLYPGMSYTQADLKEADKRLASLRWQVGVRCQVTVDETEDSEYQNIVVQVRESGYTQLAGPIHNTISYSLGLLGDLSNLDVRQLWKLFSLYLDSEREAAQAFPIEQR